MGRMATLDVFRSKSPLIAPSMLKCDFGNLHREVELLESAGAALFHLDVMDGHFVPNLSYGAMVINRIRELTDRILDAHLMISDPGKYLDDFVGAGCDCITIHIEAVPDPTELLQAIREQDVVAGLAINPGTPLEAIEPFLPQCDLILIMSVEPGFGGQKFIPSTLDKLARLRETIKTPVMFAMDGGIDLTTIGSAAAAGADICVAGSAIFDRVDYSASMRELRVEALSCRKMAAL